MLQGGQHRNYRQQAARNEVAAHNSKVGLCNIPTEILDQIVPLLSDASLRNLRLACRQLEARLFHHITKRFFTNFKTDSRRIADDLQKLEELHIQNLVKHVEIIDHSAYRWVLNMSHPNLEGYHYLVRAINKKVLTPETVSITNEYQERNTLSHIARFLIEEIVLAVEQIRITKFNVYYRLAPATVDLSRFTNYQPSHSRSLSMVKTIELPLRRMPQREVWERELFYHTPNLTHLELSLPGGWQIPSIPSEIQYYLVVPFLRLTHLKLSFSHTTTSTLLGILENSMGSLKNLSLFQVWLLEDDSWTKTLSDLAAKFVHLHHFKLEQLQSDHYEIEKEAEYCCPDHAFYSMFGKMMRRWVVASIEYAGSDACAALADVASGNDEKYL